MSSEPELVSITWVYSDGYVRKLEGEAMDTFMHTVTRAMIHEAIDLGVDIKEVTEEIGKMTTQEKREEIDKQIKLMAHESTAEFMEGMDK